MNVFLVIFEWYTPTGEWKPDRTWITASHPGIAEMAVRESHPNGCRILEVRLLGPA